MLVGGAGTSHWAMCVSPRDHWIDRQSLDFQVELVFDVACRFNEAPWWLGSSYRVLAAQTAISETLQVVRVPADRPECVVIPES
jgi:hypothetical protein